MQGHGRLSAAGYALNDDVFKRDVTDDFVLFLLNGCDDVPENGLFILGQILDEQFVVGRHVVVIKAEECLAVDVVGSLFL